MAAKLILILGVALLAVGCVSLQPFEEVARRAGAASYVEVDGQRVHVEVAGRGAPLVLVHGFGGSAYSWRRVQPRLAQSYRTIAVDLYGFGYSERPRELERYGRSGQVGLLHGVLDALGIDSAHFLAHSYGGGLVLTLAYQEPARVRSMVLVGSTAPDYATTRRRPFATTAPAVQLFVRAIALKPRFVGRVLRRTFVDPSVVTEEVVGEYLDRLRVAGAARAYRGLTRPRQEPADLEAVLLAEIRQPALVVWGSADPLIPAAAGAREAGELPAARFVVLPECGHAPMEEQPEELLAVVEPFLAEVIG